MCAGFSTEASHIGSLGQPCACSLRDVCRPFSGTFRLRPHSGSNAKFALVQTDQLPLMPQRTCCLEMHLAQPRCFGSSRPVQGVPMLPPKSTSTKVSNSVAHTLNKRGHAVALSSRVHARRVRRSVCSTGCLVSLQLKGFRTCPSQSKSCAQLPAAEPSEALAQQ